jgi:hypothetical protein
MVVRSHHLWFPWSRSSHPLGVEVGWSAAGIRASIYRGELGLANALEKGPPFWL